MSVGQWVLVVFCAAFFLVMLFALAGFLIRTFRHSRPDRNRRGKH